MTDGHELTENRPISTLRNQSISLVWLGATTPPPLVPKKYCWSCIPKSTAKKIAMVVYLIFFDNLAYSSALCWPKPIYDLPFKTFILHVHWWKFRNNDLNEECVSFLVLSVQVLVKALHIRPDPNLTAEECCLRISLQPLRLNVDQVCDNMDSNLQEKSYKSKHTKTSVLSFTSWDPGSNLALDQSLACGLCSYLNSPIWGFLSTSTCNT